jgi:alkanesulfonate monooxygenase SsuD/methylene tetrahydromethanopterin reductase-like flavin-dependent oxidoreductase (luciferase family)
MPLLPEALARAAQAAEDAGFDSVWAFDDLSDGGARPDPLTALAVAASSTSHIAIGTSVLVVPLRHPHELAVRVSTTDLVSGGRLVLGVGAGSQPSDYTSLGLPFVGRFARLERHLDAMEQIWETGSIFGAAMRNGLPRARPPVLIGAWRSRHWIRLAATRYQGWIASGARTSWTDIEDGIKTFRQAGGGRAILGTVQAAVTIDQDDLAAAGGRISLVGRPHFIREQCRRAARLGFDDLIVVPTDHQRSTLTELRDQLVT